MRANFSSTWLWRVVALVALTACVDSHPAGKPFTTIDDNNCVGCHQADYDNTTNPAHAGLYPTTCADCHVSTAWRPAIAQGHPEARFAIATGAHQGVGCRTCHRPELGSSTAGANTDCISCHVQAESDPRHVGIADYQYRPTVRNFCLTCHPAGTAEGGAHPEARFPIAAGAHRLACATCHNAALGPSTAGQNISCTVLPSPISSARQAPRPSRRR